ncbi:alpha/beta hydrolase [Lederbergia sp. NSJ-179]|uniref:alpha/beta hydrolase n=1 Tax=Lederbergia sp. NSJ-179 TaxID=2931402 RepID=UPI001FD2E9F9|nr:alpha/beta hydrolase [Lederbergia sp. NSJ-179]MCJ7842449.1 alpha/beta hydrolase [Lederbergia sp. NSJ-179]
MQKRILFITGSIIGILLIGLIFAGNYFYGQGVKRGTEIEIHKEAATVNAIASEEDQSRLAEAEAWYEKQDPEIWEMTSYDGLKLKAKYIQNENATGKAVILAHGFRNTGDDMGKLAKFYYQEGFNILLPDARGHGESEGNYIGYGWHERLDYVDWIQLLIDEHGATDILLHGNSMGAATVLMTSGEELPDEVKGIIADSGYSSVKAELKHQLKNIYHLPSFPLLDITSGITKIRAGYTFEEASAVKQVKKNTRPLFIIHGDADDLVPTAMAHELFDAAGGEKELWIVPDAGHTKAFDNVTEQYENRLKEFIDQVLS